MRVQSRTGRSGITTESNEFVAQFHDRMPVVLDDADALAWLGAEPLADSNLRHLCRGLPADALRHEALPPKPKLTRPAKMPGTTGHGDSPTLL